MPLFCLGSRLAASLGSRPWQLMATAARSSARLVALLHGFGLNSSKLADQQPKAVIATLRVEYYKLAKERHPDLAPPERKAEASERFAQLQNDFSEAIKLLEAGVNPRLLSSMGGAQPGARKMYAPPPYAAYGHGEPFQHLKQEEFDLKTRIKGHTIFWSSLFLFFCFFREFLVLSAGSTFAWSPPKELNVFRIRRYSDDWSKDNEAKKQADDEAAISPTKPKKGADFKETKTERRVSDFYQKRGISNVRRKTEPRGFGPSL